MIKKILNLENVQMLTREEQKKIKGGDDEHIICPCQDGTKVIVLSTMSCEEAELLYCFTDM